MVRQLAHTSSPPCIHALSLCKLFGLYQVLFVLLTLRPYLSVVGVEMRYVLLRCCYIIGLYMGSFAEVMSL